jgi:hypothetical protein
VIATSRLLCICLALVLLTPSLCLSGKKSKTPLTQQQACAKFSSAVVRIEAGGRSRGTGFIVSSDGFVLTASHVVRDENGEYFSAIAVELPDGSFAFAKPAVSISPESVGRDFALLKIDGKTKLPFLALGGVEDVASGVEATIIGYPFSAITAQGKNISTKFCLSATVAATSVETVTVSGKSKNAKGSVPIEKDVKVDVIYFQGPSVKGISGSPIIARDTGHVVGIVSTKLSGIGSSLMELKQQTANGLGSGLSISGIEPGKAINAILTVLDDQLANGLGAAVGIDDPKDVMTKAQKKAK